MEDREKLVHDAGAVFCRECRYWGWPDPAKDQDENRKPCKMVMLNTKPDSFCSFGRYRKNADNQ